MTTKEKELGDFLRSRRERILPERKPARKSASRRTPGLRREEVAEQAGIGTTWYTWLEQGRTQARPSGEVLLRLGKILKLSPFEMRYAFNLADRPLPPEAESCLELVPDSVKRLADFLEPVPVAVRGECYDHLYGNAALKEWIADFQLLPAGRRNWLDYLFLDPPPPNAIQPQWSQLGPRILAEFRTYLGGIIDRPSSLEVVDRLKQECPRFAKAWKEHCVISRESMSLSVKHPKFGPVEFERILLAPCDAPNLSVLIFRPKAGRMPGQ